MFGGCRDKVVGLRYLWEVSYPCRLQGGAGGFSPGRHSGGTEDTEKRKTQGPLHFTIKMLNLKSLTG